MSKVDKENACPQCGEDDIDRLIWVDTNTVECQECGYYYEPADRKQNLDNTAKKLIGDAEQPTRLPQEAHNRPQEPKR